MTHPYFTSERAEQRRADLMAQAEQHRIAAQARRGHAAPDRLRALVAALGNAVRPRRYHDDIGSPAVNARMSGYHGKAALVQNRDKPGPAVPLSNTTATGSDAPHSGRSRARRTSQTVTNGRRDDD